MTDIDQIQEILKELNATPETRGLVIAALKGVKSSSDKPTSRDAQNFIYDQIKEIVKHED